jgi:hypothetical protein
MFKKIVMLNSRRFPRLSACSLAAALGLSMGLRAQAAWETLVDGSSFNSSAVFTAEWNYNYPWGNTHNGSARMYSTNITFSGGVATMKSVPVSGQGSIHYYSATFYLKEQITINAQFPVWDISGQFEVPSSVGTWPALWLTGANSWPPESDIMEFKGSATCWQNTYNGTWASTGTVVSSPGSAWHTYRLTAVMINSTTVDFHYYIDGSLKARHTQTGFVGSPMWLIIDYQMEGSSGSPGPSGTTFTYAKNVIVRRENVSGVAPGPIPNGTYRTINRNSGKALDVANNSTGNGANIQQWSYNAGLNQQWTLVHIGSSQYVVIGRQSGRGVDVTGASTADGANIAISDYHGGDNQKWTASATSNGYYSLKAVHSGKGMDVSGQSTSDGANVQQWSYWGGNNQQWIFQAP